MKTPGSSGTFRRRSNRARRKQAREIAFRAFFDAVVWQREHVAQIPPPGVPPRLRRELLPLLRDFGEQQRRTLAFIRAESARVEREFRDLMLPVIARLGQLMPGQINRIPVMTPPAVRYREAGAQPIEDVPLAQVREIDCEKQFAVAFAVRPEMLRYAVDGSREKMRDLIGEIAHVLARVIEIEAVRHIVYDMPLGSGDRVGLPLPSTLAEVLAEHPNDAYEYVLKTTRQASAAGDWRVAGRFTGLALELTSHEKIETAAIVDENGKVFTLPRPARHHDLIHALAARGDQTPINGEQGFVTSIGRFVDRFEARAIALRERQLRQDATRSRELHTEDVW